MKRLSSADFFSKLTLFQQMFQKHQCSICPDQQKFQYELNRDPTQQPRYPSFKKMAPLRPDKQIIRNGTFCR